MRRDNGYWLLLPLLVLAALAFRRNGAIAVLALCLVLPWHPASAAGIDWWQRSDQQAHRRLEQGAQAYRKGDYAAAELAYRQILAAEPGNADAKAALAQTGLLARVEKLPPDAIARADAAPEDVELQRSAADAQVAAGDAEAAFTRLIGVVRRTAGDDRTAAREHLIELFLLFAADDPEVTKARRALAAALY